MWFLKMKLHNRHRLIYTPLRTARSVHLHQVKYNLDRDIDVLYTDQKKGNRYLVHTNFLLLHGHILRSCCRHNLLDSRNLKHTRFAASVLGWKVALHHRKRNLNLSTRQKKLLLPIFRRIIPANRF